MSPNHHLPDVCCVMSPEPTDVRSRINFQTSTCRTCGASVTVLEVSAVERCGGCGPRRGEKCRVGPRASLILRTKSAECRSVQHPAFHGFAVLVIIWRHFRNRHIIQRPKPSIEHSSSVPVSDSIPLNAGGSASKERGVHPPPSLCGECFLLHCMRAPGAPFSFREVLVVSPLL